MIAEFHASRVYAIACNALLDELENYKVDEVQQGPVLPCIIYKLRINLRIRVRVARQLTSPVPLSFVSLLLEMFRRSTCVN